MTTIHYADAAGVYLGGFGDGAMPPAGGGEVPVPPHADAIWNGSAWLWDAGAFARAGMSLTFAQLLIGLVGEGWISEAEGETWLAGTLPAAVLAEIVALPVGQQFAAKARAARPSVVERLDPLVTALAAAQGKSLAEIDTFFTTYASI